MFTRNIFSIGITTLQLTNLDNNYLCEEVKKNTKQREQRFKKIYGFK